jgi:hypothetical protein
MPSKSVRFTSSALYSKVAQGRLLEPAAVGAATFAATCSIGFGPRRSRGNRQPTQLQAIGYLGWYVSDPEADLVHRVDDSGRVEERSEIGGEGRPISPGSTTWECCSCR